MAKILNVIKKRYSPSFFTPKNVEQHKILALIEAARLAPSSFNNQPWNYVFVNKKDEARKALEGGLSITNSWAKEAPLLVVLFAREKDDRPYNGIKYHLYDSGLSSMSLVLQAESMGLKCHQMAGFNPAKVRKALGIPKSHDVIALISIGYESKNPSLVGETVAKIKETLIKQRERKPKETKFFFGRFKK